MKAINIISGISIALCLGVMSQPTMANPNGAQVVNGQVTFLQPDINTLQINNSNGSIINWQNFSINANELTHFQQSGANSAVLNQVVGNNASNIFGSLTSNGQVYLINQHGIVFGENAVVNTAGFIASTLNLSNQDFLQGKLNFSGVNAANIINQGFIIAGADGDIALIAPNIINFGVIKVEQGDVILAAGEKVTLTSFSASDVGFEIQSENNTVTNLGSVLTEGGAIGMFAGSLTHSGVISANALALDESGNVMLVAKNNLTVTDNAVISANGDSGGRIVIKSETGTTMVSGSVTATGKNGTGGVIDVLGQQVGIVNDADIDASGSIGGGQVHIGGNYQGKGELQNAVATFVGKDAIISANAIESGNGGEVIVWADETARVHGSINAHAGLLDGNGGFVETSGKQFLDVTGIELNIAAVNGSNGEWLLDPVDITISTAIDSGTIATDYPDFTSSTASNIDIATLESILNTNANVTIATNGGIGGSGDITLDTLLAFNQGNTSALTLNADNNIVISANGSVAVSGTSDLTLNLNANNDISVLGTLSAIDSSILTVDFVADNDANNVGAMSFSALMNSNGGNVGLTAATGIVFNQDTDITTGSGSLDIVTTVGDVVLQSTASLAADLSAAKPISITSAGVLSLENNGTASTINSNNNNISIVANDVVLLGTIDAGTDVLNISSGFGLDMDLGLLVAAGFVLDNSEFANLISANLVLGQSTIGSVNINSPLTISSDLTINGANINFSQPVSTTGITATGNVLLNAQGSIIDNAIAEMDVVAANITFNALFGIGNTDPLEIQLSGTTGFFDFSNSSGAVDVINTAVSATDVMQISGTNLGAGDAVTIGNDFGVTEIISSGVTSNQGLLEIVTDTLNVNALLDNNNSAVPMKLLVNEIEIAANIFSTTGGLLIGTLTEATGITFAGGVTPDLDLSQTEINFINAPFVDFGLIDVPVTGMGTGDIIFSGGIDFGARDVSFSTMTDVRFTQGAVTAVTTTGNVFFDAIGSVIGQPTAVTDISATNLDFITGVDFGNTVADAIEINVALFAGGTVGGEIYVDSPVTLTTGLINSSSGLPIWMEVNGDIILAAISTTGSNILLDTSSLTNGIGGAILDDTVVASNINGANQLQLLSETGVGTLTNPVEINNVIGNIFGDVASPGNFYLDNVGAVTGSLLLDNITTSAGEIFIRNLNTAQSTNIVTLLSAIGNITLESNSDINVNNNVIASGGSNIDLRVVGATGSVNINSSVQADNGIATVSTINGDITFGSTGYISTGAGAINLNASGFITDAGAINAIGGGTAVNQLTAASGNGISLTSAANDANTIYLATTAGNIDYTDATGFALDAAYATNDGLAGGTATGDVTLTAAGLITDANAGAINIAAVNAVVTASNGIGDGDALETNILTSLNFNNSLDGSVQFADVSANNINVFGDNSSANLSAFDFTEIVSLNGSLTVPVSQTLSSANTFLILNAQNPSGSIFVDGALSVTSAASFIELKASSIDVAGTISATGTALQLSVGLLTDEISINGSVNGGLGDLAIETLTGGRAITLGAVDASGNSLDLLQTDVNAIMAARLSIGLMDTVTALGSGDITIAGALDVGAKDIRVQTLGNIIFTNGSSSGLSTTGLMELNAELAVIGDNLTGINLIAAGLSLEAKLGIGSVNAIRTQVTDLTAFNQFSNNLNVSNTGALVVTDSANLAGSMSLSSDNSLTLTPFAGLAGTTGAVAQTDLTLKAASGLFINGVVSASNINLLSDSGITINEIVTATGSLVMNADTDANATGDLLIENTNTGVLDITAANMSINASSVNLQASGGAVHVSSAGSLNLAASGNLNIFGGDGLDFDAYLSAGGNLNMDVAGNVLLSGGTASNTAASIFDVTGTNTNILNMMVAGNLTLNGGLGASSGAYISSGEVNMTVAGDMTLLGSSANLSPAQLRGFGLNMSLNVGGNLSLSDGVGIDSLAQVISNDGLGYLQLSYLTCSGCATGLIFLDKPITNTTTNEIVNTQNTSVITTEPTVSSSDALLALLDESTVVNQAEIITVDSESTQDSETTIDGSSSTTASEDEEATQEKEPEAKVLVCR